MIQNNRIIPPNDIKRLESIFKIKVYHGWLTYQDLFDWLRVNKKILVNIYPLDDWDNYTYTLLSSDTTSPFFVIPPKIDYYQTSYEQCEIDILKQIFEIYE